MSQATATVEPVEAVIISGPRKGEMIILSGEEPQITPEEQRLLDFAVEQAAQLAESARAAAAEADGLLQDLRRLRGA
jgi:hypothetical protein